MNTFGKNLRVTTFGESHGPAMGGIIDGFPSGFKIDFERLQKDLDQRKPGSSKTVSQRKEEDIPEFLSGINKEGITLGTPIGFIIRNKDHKSNDYSELDKKYRPNHADFTYDAKYGLRDARGGGRSSARETVNWVVAGSLASQWLKTMGIEIQALLTGVKDADFTTELRESLIRNPWDLNKFQLSQEKKDKIEAAVLNAKTTGDSIGGIVTCIITGLKPGTGNPVFNKLQAELAKAMMSINAAKGFEYGAGFSSQDFYGSESIDRFISQDDKISTITNFSGGIQGGISNGMPIFFSVIFKPTPTIMKELQTITTYGEPTTLLMKGRHDPCVALRGVAVVRAMAALVIADFLS